MKDYDRKYMLWNIVTSQAIVTKASYFGLTQTVIIRLLHQF